MQFIFPVSKQKNKLSILHWKTAAKALALSGRLSLSLVGKKYNGKIEREREREIVMTCEAADKRDGERKKERKGEGV